MALSTIVAADSPAPPKILSAISEDGESLVRVLPSWLYDAESDEIQERGGPAKAIFYLRDPVNNQFVVDREIHLLNPVSPGEIYLGNNGGLVTINNWPSAGFDLAVVVYDPAGQPLASYKLEELYSENLIAKFLHTVSNIWWRCYWISPELEYDGLVSIVDRLGGQIKIDLSTGNFSYDAEVTSCPQ